MLEPNCNVSQICRQFGISRKTAYKWKKRFGEKKGSTLKDLKRGGARGTRAYESCWRVRLKQMRGKHPSWGPKKLLKLLQDAFPKELKTPSLATLGRWLKQEGIVGRKSRRSRKGPVLELPMAVAVNGPNDVWTVDFKGWFRTADGSRCDPLTVRDLHSRFLLGVVFVNAQSDPEVRRAFQGLFKKYGLPKAIKCDNGTPFGGNGPLGLSRLSVWWVRLGIKVEFSRRAHPEDNAAHEQMHGVMKKETAKPARANLRAQKRRTKQWVEEYNFIRPHESLGQKPPCQFYQPSDLRLNGSSREAFKYGSGYEVRRVRNRGNVKWRGKLRFIGRAFVGESIGLKEGSAGVQKVYLGEQLIGELHEVDLGGMRPASWKQKSRSEQKEEKGEV